MTVLLSLFIGLIAHAWETDDVSCRFQRLRDSAPLLNQETNRRIDEAIAMQEDPEPGAKFCNRHILTDLRASLGSPFFGNLETWADEEQGVDKCKRPLSSSVYSDAYSSLRLMTTGVAVSTVGLSSTVNIGGTYLGLDKIAHFMTEGYALHIQNGKGGARRVLKSYSVPQEEGPYGLSIARASGIYSYADIMANYQGLLFWESLFEDPGRSIENPYLRCKNGKWVRVRDFKWEENVNVGLNESLNCNRYYSADMEERVNARTAGIAKANAWSKNSTCPMDDQACAKFVKSFPRKEILEIALNPKCHEKGRQQMATLPEEPKVEAPGKTAQ